MALIDMRGWNGVSLQPFNDAIRAWVDDVDNQRLPDGWLLNLKGRVQLSLLLAPPRWANRPPPRSVHGLPCYETMPGCIPPWRQL